MSDGQTQQAEDANAASAGEILEQAAESVDAQLEPDAGATEAAGTLQPAEFENLQPGTATGNAEINLDFILDVPVTIAMEIGRTKINIRDLLQLNPGSVVELDRLAGEPMDVLVNGTLIAQGEVVVVEDKFGIRLTDVISPEERIKKLR